MNGGSVTVQATRNGDVLTLEVRDTGMGLAADARHTDGFGLAQVRERLETTYGSQARLTVLPGPDAGVGVCIEFPCRG